MLNLIYIDYSYLSTESFYKIPYPKLELSLLFLLLLFFSPLNKLSLTTIPSFYTFRLHSLDFVSLSSFITISHSFQPPFTTLLNFLPVYLLTLSIFPLSLSLLFSLFSLDLSSHLLSPPSPHSSLSSQFLPSLLIN